MFDEPDAAISRTSQSRAALKPTETGHYDSFGLWTVANRGPETASSIDANRRGSLSPGVFRMKAYSHCRAYPRECGGRLRPLPQRTW
jgi:hypothetical protein